MMTGEVLQRFERAKPAGPGKWMARCPAHEDRNPSLSISEKDGKTLLNCHAGCSTESIVAAVGLQMSDLFTDGPKIQRQIVATYDYTDESGALLFQTVRYEPKDFRQRRTDGNGGWIWSLGNTRRVLYRLPELLKAKCAVIVEGEKDADTGRQLGLTFTCNPHGAGKWKPEYSGLLKGKRVVVIADADAPGVAHARDVGRSLLGVAESVKLIEALPGSGVKDLSDFVRTFPDPTESRKLLLALIADTSELTQAAVGKWRAAPDVPGVLASEVKPERVRWLWEGRLALGKTTIFEGDPDEGKSTAALDLAARVTRGSEMPNRSAGIPASGAVVVSLEDGISDTIVPRLMAANADRSKVRIIQTIKGADGFDRTPTLPVDLLAIEAAIKDVDAKIVVVDPFVATLAGETNSFRDQDIRRVLAPVAALAERTGVAVIVIRHLNKGNNPNPKYRGGGSIGILGAARASFLFGANPDDGESKVMASVKMNVGPKPSAMKYRLQGAEVAFEGVVIQTVRVTWEGESQHTAKSILAEPETEEESNALTDAKNFLLEALAEGPMDSEELKRVARKAGHSEKTLF